MVKVKLESYEGNIHECELKAAKMSLTIKNMIETTSFDPSGYNNAIPLRNEAITDEVLKKLIQYMEYHRDDPLPDYDFYEHKERRTEQLSSWDKTFIDVKHRAFLYDIMDAANYLDIKGLVEVCAKYICSKIKGKTNKEVREILNISNDFTPEEEEAIRNENGWINARE